MINPISITIKFCNRSYRIKVEAENEAIVRERVKSIQLKMDDLKKTFPGRDDHDYMAMTMIDYVTAFDEKKEHTKEPSFDDSILLSKLQVLQQLLDS
jgi:cell division protein ZapA (FtsZ GTPase activity inhibitor)